MNSGLAKHKAVANFKFRKSYPFYNAEYGNEEGIYFFGGINQEGVPNNVSQLVFNRYVPVLKRVKFSGLPPSPVDPIIEKYNESSIVIVSGDQYEREVNIFNFKEQKFSNVNLGFKPSLGGMGSAIILNRSNYYVFYGLGK